MKQKQSAVYGFLILVLTIITTLSCLRAEGADRAVDIDGHGYNTVSKGGKVWMRDNLNVSRYRNGDEITQAETREEWLDAAAKGEGAWCYYNNDKAKGKTYGRLYNWFAVNDPRGIAPVGWHVPSREEWDNLATALAGVALPGRKKSPALKVWHYPSASVDNAIHFNAVPGGIRETEDDAFRFIGEEAFFWSASEATPAFASYAQFNFENSEIKLFLQEKREGISVRCIRD